MKAQFVFALLAASLNAKKLDNKTEHDFINFAAKYNKHYSSTDDLAKKIDTWKNNKAKVKKLNDDNAGTGVRFAINEAGDLDPEEFAARQGLDNKHKKEKPSKKEMKEKHEKRARPDHAGRKLQDHTTASINWAEMGYVGPVKNQGWCGSCWAFAATTVQETMQAIMTGSEPVRLSEQECVDCDTNSYGCYGGWMSNCWAFSQEFGSQSNADYPYEAENGNCRHQENKKIASKAIANGWLDGTDQMAHDLYWYGPFSIAVSAGNECWQFYESGILSSANGCPTSIDHGVVVVGIDRTGETPYWIVQNSWDTWWGDNGFIHLAVEEGDGVSGMNLYAEWMDVDWDYPIEANCPNSEVDESQNAMGWGRCSSDDECYGYRECSAWGLCVGKDYCYEDIPDQCSIDETQNEMGSGRCGTSFECKGDRTCSMWGFCEGECNCDQ